MGSPVMGSPAGLSALDIKQALLEEARQRNVWSTLLRGQRIKVFKTYFIDYAVRILRQCLQNSGAPPAGSVGELVSQRKLASQQHPVGFDRNEVTVVTNSSASSTQSYEVCYGTVRSMKGPDTYTVMFRVRTWCAICVTGAQSTPVNSSIASFLWVLILAMKAYGPY